MKHELGGAYEPIGGHGMSLRRRCKICNESFVVDNPDEIPPLAEKECLGDATRYSNEEEDTLHTER